MPTSTEVPIMSGTVGCDKYMSREVIRVDAAIVPEQQFTRQIDILKRNLGERFISYEMTGTSSSWAEETGGVLVDYEYRYSDVIYYVEIASVFQLLNILRANPFWILSRYPNFDGNEVIGFTEID